MIAGALLDVVGNSSPYIAVLGICLLTMAFGQLISNTTTILIMVPIGTAVAGDLDASVLPFLMALAVGTPAQTQRANPVVLRYCR